MAASRLLALLLVALLCNVRTAFALSTDQDISAMFTSAAQMDAAGNGSGRDAIIRDIRTELRSRMAADSAVESAEIFLSLLDEVTQEQDATRKRLLSELRNQASTGDTTGIGARYASLLQRYPEAKLPSLKSIVDLANATRARDSIASADSCSKPGACKQAALPHSDTASARQSAPPSTCPSGPPRPWFVRPPSNASLKSSDSALLLTMSVQAPCPIAKLVLEADSTVLRPLPLAIGRTGIFEIDDAITLAPGTRRIALLACDSFGSCQRAFLQVTPSDTIPPWIPWSCGGIILLGVATGFVALFRRPHSTPPQGVRGIQVRSGKSLGSKAAPSGRLDIVETLRSIITEAERNLPRGPRVISRLSTIPAIDVDPAALESALLSLLRLPIARAGLRGVVLVATGRGPVSLEVVLEDNGPDLDDTILKQLFDPSIGKLRERQGLDKELLEAADVVMRHQGHLSPEPRIDGGLRLRIRLPLPSSGGPRANSLLK